LFSSSGSWACSACALYKVLQRLLTPDNCESLAPATHAASGLHYTQTSQVL
jgi:hypothetical protein